VEVVAVDSEVDGVGPAQDLPEGGDLPAGAVAAAVESVTAPVTARNQATAAAPRTDLALLPRGTAADPKPCTVATSPFFLRSTPSLHY